MKRLFALPRATWVAFAILVVIGVLAVPSGFYLDDYVFVDRLDHAPLVSRTSIDLYDFTYEKLPGEPALGFWVRSPSFRMHFLRPLASLLFAVDHAIAGHSPALYHVHSLLWAALLVFLLARLYQRVLGPRVGGLALILFALAPRVALSTGWIASRHTVVTTALVVAAILTYDRARREGRPRAFVAPAALAAAALLAGESGLAAWAYFAAYELIARAGEPLRARAKIFAAFAAPVALYLALYVAFGLGVRDNPVYVDPLRHPLEALPRVGNAVADLLWGIPAEMLADPGIERQVALFGLVGLLVLAPLGRLALGRVSADTRRGLAWLATGSLLSIFPTVGAAPSSRIYLAAAIGGVPVVAALLAAAWWTLRDRVRAWPTRIYAGLLGAILTLAHLVVGPASLGLLLIIQSKLGGALNQLACGDPQRQETDARPTVVLVGTWLEYYVPSIQDVRCPHPAGSTLVVWGNVPYRVSRVGERELVVEAEQGDMYRGWRELSERASPMVRGETAHRGPLTLRVHEVAPIGPRSIDVEVDRPLEQIRLLRWEKTKYVAIPLPAKGESVVVPAPGTGFELLE